MQYLIDAAATDSIQRLADVALEYDEVQGAALSTDWAWRLLNRTRYLLAPDTFDALCNDLRDLAGYQTPGKARMPYRLFGDGSPPEEEEWLSRLGLDESETAGPIDPGWSPPDWPWFPNSPGLGGSTFVFTATLRPNPGRDVLAALRERLDARLREDDFPVRVRIDIRPVARLQARQTVASSVRGGSSVSQGRKRVGTAGGILTNAQGEALVGTCAHVAALATPQSGLMLTSGDRAIGATTAWASTPKEVVGGFTMSTAQSYPDIDFALLRPAEAIAPSGEIGGLGVVHGTQPIAHMSEGDLVQTAGAATGLQPLRIGEFVLAHKFALGGKRFGLRDLFQLRRRSRFWCAAGLVHHPTAAGDSGGWVIQQDGTGPTWAGTIVGGDGPVGYACFAERVLAAAAIDDQLLSP